jgi:putative intracellular protease/amidase
MTHVQRTSTGKTTQSTAAGLKPKVKPQSEAPPEKAKLLAASWQPAKQKGTPPQATQPRTVTATELQATPASLKALKNALTRGDAKTALSLVQPHSAQSSEALKKTYLQAYGRDLEFDLRGFTVGMKGLSGASLDKALRALHGPRLEETAQRIATLTASPKTSTPKGRKEIYSLLATAGGEERQLLAETFKRQTGKDLMQVLRPVFAQAQKDVGPLTTPPAKTVAVVVSSGNWKSMLSGTADKPVGGYHWREVEAYVKEALDRGYTPVFFTADGLPASPDAASLFQNKVMNHLGLGVGANNNIDSPQGKVILEGLSRPRSLADFDATAFATLHIAGGHGSHHDLVGNPAVERAATALHERGQVVTAVCHATPALGALVRGGPATGFSPKLDAVTLRKGWVLPEFDPPYDAHQGLRDLGATVSKLGAAQAFVNVHHTETFVKDGVPVVTGTGPEATDDAARIAFDWLAANGS